MPYLSPAEIDALDDDIRSAIIPISCLGELKNDIVRFQDTESLNDYQKWIVHEGYILDVPELPFQARSILITAVKHKLVNVLFHYKGNVVRDFFCLSSSPLRERITSLLEENGYQAEFLYWLPQKRLAVCAGLCEYGRNNITYTDEWGSWFELLTFFSDLPADDSDFIWRGVKRMDNCESCASCMNACTTGAIKDDTYLIDNVRCLTLFIESDKMFPAWITREDIRSVVGCRFCQDACPKNKDKFECVGTVSFSEEETALLMAGAALCDMPDSLLLKVDLLAMEWRLPSLPKSLEVLFGNGVTI